MTGAQFLQVSEDSPQFKKIHDVLEKKIIEEVSKLNIQLKEKLVEGFVSKIKSLLQKKKIIYVTVFGRIKGKDSIVEKVIRKLHRFIHIIPEDPIENILSEITIDKIRSNIFDLIAIRIILPTQKACYDCVEMMEKQKVFRYVEEEFYDYIKKPKENGYKAIHIVLKDEMQDKFFEVQIMSKAMHKDAMTGKASRKEYRSSKNTKIFRNVALLVVALAAAGGVVYGMTRKKK